MINKELLDYIYASIFPEYEKNDAGHRFDHIIYVIERSLAFADRCNKCYPDKEPIDNNMVYVIAAYHDIGHHIDHLNHEAVSAEIMACDKNLTKWFTPEQIEIMRVAIAEHRSCLEGEPTTIYGKIVSSADRNVDMTSIYKRCYEYRRVHNPEMTNDELAEEAYCHVRDKFGVGGYVSYGAKSKLADGKKVTYYYMVCRRHKMPRYYDSKCHNRNIKRADLETEVFARIKNLETSGEIEFTKKNNSPIDYSNKIEAIDKKIAKLLDLYIENMIPKEALDAKLADFNKQKEKLLSQSKESDYEVTAMEEFIKKGIPDLHQCNLETQTAVVDLFINQIIITEDGLQIIWNQ